MVVPMQQPAAQPYAAHFQLYYCQPYQQSQHPMGYDQYVPYE